MLTIIEYIVSDTCTYQLNHTHNNQMRQSDYFDKNAMDTLIFGQIFTTKKWLQMPSIYSYRCPLIAYIVSDTKQLNHTHNN